MIEILQWKVSFKMIKDLVFNVDIFYGIDNQKSTGYCHYYVVTGEMFDVWESEECDERTTITEIKNEIEWYIENFENEDPDEYNQYRNRKFIWNFKVRLLEQVKHLDKEKSQLDYFF